VRGAAEAFTPDARAAAAGAVPAPDRGTVVAAVERYLAARGLSRSAAVSEGVVANVAAEVVDRFLARRSTVSTPAPSGPGFG